MTALRSRPIGPRIGCRPGPKRGRVRFLERQRAVAEGRPRHPFEFTGQADAEHQRVAKHGIDRRAGDDLPQIGDPLRRVTDEHVGEGAPDDLNGREVLELRPILGQVLTAEVLGVDVGQRLRADRRDLRVEHPARVTEHAMTALDQPRRDGQRVGGVCGDGDGGEQERASTVAPRIGVTDSGPGR
jgi:hypothetical protein